MTSREKFLKAMAECSAKYATVNVGELTGQVVELVNVDDPQMNAFLVAQDIGARVDLSRRCVHVRLPNGRITIADVNGLYPCDAPSSSGDAA